MPWTNFRIDPTSDHYKPLDRVTHTCHISQALQILETTKIRPYLVFDESILNDKRILVGWLSPNYWHNGFRYGNLMFGFDFPSLVAGKRYYWVEAIAYNTRACRILITDDDCSHILQEYDPASSDGPWVYNAIDDRHYYNGEHCLEFMFTFDIEINRATSFEFVNHHEDFCSLRRTAPETCPDKRVSAISGGAKFLAAVASTPPNLTPLNPLLAPGGVPGAYLKAAFGRYLRRAGSNVTHIGPVFVDDLGIALARAVASLYASDSIDEAKLLVSLYESNATFEQATAELIGGLFHVTDSQLLLDD